MGKITEKDFDKSFVEQLKEKPGKAVMLGLILVIALGMWGKRFLGDDGKKAIGPVQPNVGGPSGPSGPAGSVALATPPLGPINDFASAQKRLNTWREPLLIDKQGRYDKPIFHEILTPTEPEHIDLTLTGTMILGKTRYALFSGKKVQEGGQIGRYVIQAIRPREVDVIDGDQVRTIRMAQTVFE